MTTTHTQNEWLAIFDQAEHDLPKSTSEYKAPSLGTAAFAQTIDHTLLKLEATGEQIDALCEEAKRYNFKVCHLLRRESWWNVACFLL